MRAAPLVQIVLLGLLAVIGLLATVAVAVDWLQGLDTWSWEESSCTIESSEAVARPQYGDTAFLVSYSYYHRGKQSSGDAYRHGYGGSDTASQAEVLAARYPVGDKVRCWVDPHDSGRSALRRANLWDGFWIFVPLVFVAVGAGFLWLLHGRGSRADKTEPASSAATPRKRRFGIAGGAMVLFFGVFFLFGIGFLIPFFVRPTLQVVEARSWVETPCSIVSSAVRTHPGDDGATYSIDVLFRYEIDGREYKSNRYQFMGGSSGGYEAKARIVEALPAGASALCWVDLDDPFEAVLERGFTGDHLFGLVPLIFVLIGIAGLTFAIKAPRGAREAAARPSWVVPTTPGKAPTLGRRPDGSAGEPLEGTLVLEPTMGPFGRVGCTLAIAVFWNGFTSLFVWQIIDSWRAGIREWFVIVIVAPFVLIGLLLLTGIPYSILALLNPRARVHLTPGTLQAGESAQLEWAFKGFASRIRRLKIWLEATETRTEVGDSNVQIHSEPLDTPAITVLERGRDLPLEYGGVSFTLPADTPASSEGDVSVKWTLRLQGDIAYWPDVSEAYEVKVVPRTRS